MIDEQCKLQKGSPLIDNGNLVLYQEYLAKDNLAYGDKDILGGQRIYNQKIDLGAFEYDWRNDFAEIAGKRNLSVETASENVCVRSASELRIPAESSMTFKWELQDKGSYSFRVASSGTGVTVLRDGVEISSDADGNYRFWHNEGAVITRIVISCDESSSALASSFSRIKGLVLVVQ